MLHHLALAHGRAARAPRAARRGLEVGVACNASMDYPVAANPSDPAAAKRARMREFAFLES